MTLDYTEIGKRIARRRKELGLKQSEVEKKADLGYKIPFQHRTQYFHSFRRSYHAAGCCLGHNPG